MVQKDEIVKDSSTLGYQVVDCGVRSSAEVKARVAKAAGAADIGSAFPGAYSAAAGFYARINEPKNALRQYDDGIKALPKQKALFQKQKMFFLAARRQHAGSAALANAVLKDNPKDTDARTLRASIELGKEDSEKTIKDLREVIGQSPRNWLAHYSLGRAYLMRGELEAARKHFGQALDVSRDHPGSLIGLAPPPITRSSAACIASGSVPTIRHCSASTPMEVNSQRRKRHIS